MWWVDENIGFGEMWLCEWCVMMMEKIFDGVDVGGFYGNVVFGGSEEGVLCGGGEFVEFVMDGVFFDGFGYDWFKCIEFDM